jgi:hypothetical protein
MVSRRDVAISQHVWRKAALLSMWSVINHIELLKCGRVRLLMAATGVHAAVVNKLHRPLIQTYQCVTRKGVTVAMK